MLEDPGTARALPARLAPHLEPDGRTLFIRSTDIAGALRELADFAERHRLGLAGLEVGPPSLEDAYLAVIDRQTCSKGTGHD